MTSQLQRHPRRRRGSRVPFISFVLVASLAAMAFTGLARAGDPKTPLGKWMKPNMGAPLAGEDYDTLKKSLDLVASKAPKGDYPQWSAMATAGSAAAAKQDLKAVKASCKQCHDAYKEKYIKDFPALPFP
jgi:cytochrome c553